jgi:hypothetical protein
MTVIVATKLRAKKSVHCTVNTLFITLISSASYHYMLILKSQQELLIWDQRYFTDNIKPSAQFLIHDFMYTVHSGASRSCMASSNGTKNSTDMEVDLIYCRDMGALHFLYTNLLEYISLQSASLWRVKFSKMGCCVDECLIPDVLKHHSALTFTVKQPKDSHTGK